MFKQNAFLRYPQQIHIKILTLHVHLTHFCSPCDARIGWKSCPFSYTFPLYLQPPFSRIAWGDRSVPLLLPWSPISSGLPERTGLVRSMICE